MADIELVIKIPEGLKNEFESEQWTALSCMEMKEALIYGKPLPKGHGRLIDADAFIKEKCSQCDGYCDVCDCDCLNCKFEHWCEFIKDIDSADVIVEADKEVDE